MAMADTFYNGAWLHEVKAVKLFDPDGLLLSVVPIEECRHEDNRLTLPPAEHAGICGSMWWQFKDGRPDALIATFT